MSKKDQMEIEVSTQLQGAEDGSKMPEMAAYAFDSNAKLIASAVIKEGRALLSAPAPQTADQLRILVGPKQDEQQADYGDLVRRGAKLQRIRVANDSLRQKLDVILFPNEWLCWLRSACPVRGNLNKRVLIGGSYVNYPVCDATVEVYEVDPLWIIIPKLPLDILDRFREIILDPIPPRIDPPIPFPEPRPDPVPGLDRATFSSMNVSAEGAQRLSVNSKKAIAMLSGNEELRFAAQLGSEQQFRQALIEFPLIIRPLLCWFYPHLVTMQKVATTKTDDCGKFNALFFRGCGNPDQPDLYFKARQRIFGFLNVTIYAPTPIACHTWWNYNCGTEVNLYTSHPWAQTCSPCPPVTGPEGSNLWVAFMSIGAHGLNNIHGTSVDLQAETNSTTLGLTESGAPWGGTLLPRLEFSNALKAAGVDYYQLSWRRGTTGDFVPLTGTINHYYRHEITNTDGIALPVWTPVTMGPKEVDDGSGNKTPYLYSIPYTADVPAGGVWDVPPNITEIKEHFASGKFFTREDVPGVTYSEDGVMQGTDVSGIYQLKLELFDSNGQPIDIAAQGIVYAVPRDPDASGVIESDYASDLNLVHGNAMIINLNVNNNHCKALIDAPVIGGQSADTCCGVLNYSSATDSVDMPWEAIHLHNFATYSFSVVRGSRVVLQETGAVTSSGSVTTRTVDQMMNTNLPAECAVGGCQVAGFSENLYVRAMATDGWARQTYLDDRDVRAFVLSEQETVES